MTPSRTPAECHDALRADFFRRDNARMPPDPDLEFTVDLGLKRRPKGRAA